MYDYCMSGMFRELIGLDGFGRSQKLIYVTIKLGFSSL